MRKQFLVCIAILFVFSSISNPGPAAQSQQSPAPAGTLPKQQDPVPAETVVRITTRLIQIDAVVVDKDDRLITDLKAADFQILEDGKERKITNFSFVTLQPETPRVVAKNPVSPIASPPVPPVNLIPEQVRRTIALIVDDLGLSFESTAYARTALKKFVDEQIQPGDLVAIIRSSAGNGALQQFTADKRLLHAAIERIQWYPFGRGRIGAFEPMGGRSSIEALKAQAQITTPGGGGGGGGGQQSRSVGVMKDSDADGEFTNNREQISSTGTIGAIRYVIDGLRDLPGRKSVVLMSDGLPMFPRIGGIMGDRVSIDRSSRDIVTALNNLTETANRASVVIYAIDARGLQTLGLTAADDTQSTFEMLQAEGGQAAAVSGTIVNRKNDLAQTLFRTQDGLNYLASQTGGFFFRNNNDLAGGIKKVMEDQRGYYLIGYEPDESTFDEQGRRTFHKLQVRVKNPKLRVRSRTGFFGISDEEVKKPVESTVERLKAALASPFTANAVNVSLTSLFSGEPATPFLRTLVHVDARDLSFTKDPNGDYLTEIDIAATVHDENGLTIERGGRSFKLRLKGADFELFRNTGITYSLDVPVKKAGAYQMRLAVLDESSKRLGSATQFIEVPDLKKSRLALSGISMSGEYEKGGKPEAHALAGAALRKMRRGMVLNYAYAIYNAKLDPSNRPDVTTQVKLFYDGQEILTGKEVSLKEPQASKTTRIFAGGGIDLGANLKSGNYILQVIVKDLAAKEKYRVATQWLNFEIVD